MREPIESAAAPEFIVFFDGVCNLCNGFVDFLIRFDRHQRLHVASLQGETAERLLPEYYRQSLTTIIVWNNGQLSKQSDAILKILWRMGGFWRLFGIGYVIPRPIRNRLYNWFAQRRYYWFGQKKSCRLPTPEEQRYFLP